MHRRAVHRSTAVVLGAGLLAPVGGGGRVTTAPPHEVAGSTSRSLAPFGLSYSFNLRL